MTPGRTAPGKLRRTGRALLRDGRGTAGLEFTFVAPLMCILLFGTYEGCQLISAHMRENAAVETVAKLVAQQTGITPAMMQNFCAGGQLVMTPYPAATLAMTIASVTNTGGSLQEDWEYHQACPVAGPTFKPAVTVLAASYSGNKVPNAGDSVIIVQSSYSYAPVVTYVLGGATSFSHAAFARPRGNATITCSGC